MFGPGNANIVDRDRLGHSVHIVEKLLETSLLLAGSEITAGMLTSPPGVWASKPRTLQMWWEGLPRQTEREEKRR